jgi:hypothetical protein
MTDSARSAMLFILVTLILTSSISSAAADELGVTADDPTRVRIGEYNVAVFDFPKSGEEAHDIQADNGFTIVGAGIRQEYALFDDRLEFTYDFTMARVGSRPLVLFLPLPPGAKGVITYGRTHPAPPSRVEVTAGTKSEARSNYDERYGTVGPAPPADAAAGALFPLRFVTVHSDRYKLSVDVHPAGAISEDPSYAESPLRMFSVVPMENGIRITASSSGGYGQYPGHIKGKIIFYLDGRSFEEVHPFAYAAEYGPLEDFLRFDFSDQPARQKSDPIPIANDPYNEDRGYGWVATPGRFQLKTTSLKAKIHGTFATSNKPGRFRFDAPPGYYFVTLNFGNADGITGPLQVAIDGKVQLDNFKLGVGRFRNTSHLIKTTTGIVHVDIQGLKGKPWLLNGMFVKPMGTLNEDFIFTRPWWHFEIE